MNLGITLKSAEKVFGPALPGIGEPANTLSAVRYAGGKAKKFAGVLGLPEHAIFHVHFPTPVDWNLVASKKGVPDFVNDLKESGPQGGQGRAAEVAAFLEKYESVKAKLQAKQAAAEKKARTAKWKAESAELKERLKAYLGEQQVTLMIGSESVSLPVKITVNKKGKMKIVAEL